MWINAIRLAGWERSRCQEIYTGSLLGLREPKPLGWVGYEAGYPTKGRFEGWLKVRLPGDTEWRRVWTVVLRGGSAGAAQQQQQQQPPQPTPVEVKKAKRSSLLSFGKNKDKEREAAAQAALLAANGGIGGGGGGVTPAIEGAPGDGAFSTIAFYGSRPKGRDQPICIAQHGTFFSSCSLSPFLSLTLRLAPLRTQRSLLRRLPLPRIRKTHRTILLVQNRRNFYESFRRVQNGLGSRR